MYSGILGLLSRSQIEKYYPTPPPAIHALPAVPTNNGLALSCFAQRMLAHKVAQHYGLKTATVPCLTEGQGSGKSQLQVIAALEAISRDNDLQDQQV